MTMELSTAFDGIDLEWFVMDEVGHAALFCSNGNGFVPRHVAEASDAIASIAALIPTPHWGSDLIWADYGAAGLYVYDWTWTDQAYLRGFEPTEHMPPALRAAIEALPVLPRIKGRFAETACVTLAEMRVSENVGAKADDITQASAEKGPSRRKASHLPADIHAHVFALTTAIVDTWEPDDPQRRWRLHGKLRDYCEEMAAAGRDHPFLWESLGDLTTDDEAAIVHYLRGLALSETLGATGYAASICLALAERYAELGRTAVAAGYAARAAALARDVDDAQLQADIADFLRDQGSAAANT